MLLTVTPVNNDLKDLRNQLIWCPRGDPPMPTTGIASIKQRWTQPKDLYRMGKEAVTGTGDRDPKDLMTGSRRLLTLLTS
jgi:hypothetical protein